MTCLHKKSLAEMGTGASSDLQSSALASKLMSLVHGFRSLAWVLILLDVTVG